MTFFIRDNESDIIIIINRRVKMDQKVIESRGYKSWRTNKRVERRYTQHGED